MISIVVPAFNEDKSLPELFRRTKAVMEAEGWEFEFIVVDDGSTDETESISLGLLSENPQVVYIQHRQNYGKSAALMQGFALARGEWVVMIDADLQDHPEDIPALIESLKGGVDLVNGWRADRKDTGKKRLVSRIYNALVKHWLGTELHDINCGLKAMRREVCETLQLIGDLHRLIPAIAEIHGFKVAEVKVRHADRRHGTSRYPLLRYGGILDLIALVGLRGLQVRPLHFFSKVSANFWLAAFASAVLWGVAGRWLSHETPIIRLISPTFGAVACWLVMVGTLLPALGFYMEVSMFRSPSSAWHTRLVRRIVRADDTPET